MKKLLSILLVIALLASVSVFAAGSSRWWRKDAPEPVVRQAFTSYPFYYSEHYASEQLAEKCALYSMLAYRDSVYHSLGSTKTVLVAGPQELYIKSINGYWTSSDGNFTAAKKALAKTLSDDGFTDLWSYRLEDYTGRDPVTKILSMSKRTASDRNYSPFILAHRVIRTGEQAILVSAENGSSSYGELQDQILILFRGTTDAEWYGDFEVTGTRYDESKDYHVSFQKAVDDAVASLADYISFLDLSHDLKTDKISLLVTGHSRGAAVANMLAHQLTDIRNGKASDYKSDKNMDTLAFVLYDTEHCFSSVYAYTFATPNVATVDKIARDGYYSNIFNYCFRDDFVPNLPLYSWQWDKYGRTYWATAAELLKYGYLSIPKTDQFGSRPEYYRYCIPNEFACDTELYFGITPPYNTKYSNQIVATTSDMTDHPGASGVGNYYNYRYRDRKNNLLPPLYNFMHTYVAGALYKMGIGEDFTYEGAQLAAFALDSCKEYKKLARVFGEGALSGTLMCTHMPISYYSGMMNCFSSFIGEGTYRSALLMSDSEAELSGAWDSEFQTDEGDLAALKEILSLPAAVPEGSESSIVCEMLGWDMDDLSTWDGADWEVEDGVQHLCGLDLSCAGLQGVFDASVFPDLRTLDVSCNSLTELKLQGANLSDVVCFGNALTELDCSDVFLYSLDCSGNSLTSLTNLGLLSYLDCSGNRLTSLPWDELASLWYLDCSRNLMDPYDQGLVKLYEQLRGYSETAIILPQNMPDDAVYDESDLACLAALAAQGDNASLLGWDLTHPASLTGVEWTRCGDTWYISRLSLDGLGLTGLADFSSCPLLSSVDVSDNELTGVSASGCPSLLLLNAENNRMEPDAVQSLEALEETAVVIGRQKYVPEGVTLSPEDTAALKELADRYSLDWTEDTLFTNENLRWETEDGKSARLTFIDLSRTCAWGDLDLTCFTALKSFLAQGTQLDSLKLPPSVTEIPDYAFAVSLDLNTVYCAGKAPAVYENTFAVCSPDLDVFLEFDNALSLMSEGDTDTLGVSNFNDGAALTWYSSDETVAEVDSSGGVTAVGPGAAEIAAVSDDGFIALGTVYVRGLSLRADYVGTDGADVTLFAAGTDVGTVRLLLAAYSSDGRMLNCKISQGVPGTEGLPLSCPAENAAVFKAFALSERGAPMLKVWERAVE